MKTSVFTLVVGSAFLSFASEFSWTGGGIAGRWTDPANWSANEGYPKGGDTAVFSANVAKSVTITEDFAIGSGKLTLSNDVDHVLTFDCSISGDGAIHKDGGGELHLKQANTFAGGFTQMGVYPCEWTQPPYPDGYRSRVDTFIYDGGAFGTGPVSLDCDGKSHGTRLNVMASMTIPNDVQLSADGSQAGNVRYQGGNDQVVHWTGRVHGPQRYTCSVADGQKGTKVYFDGPTQFPGWTHWVSDIEHFFNARAELSTNGTFVPSTGSVFHFNASGNVVLNLTCNGDFFLDAENALDNGANKFNLTFGKKGWFHLDGHDQTYGNLATFAMPSGVVGGYGYESPVDQAAVLALTNKVVESLVFAGEFTGAAGLWFAPVSQASTFTVSNIVQKTAGAMRVGGSGNVLKFVEGSGFSGLGRLQIDGGGMLTLASDARDSSADKVVVDAAGGGTLDIADGRSVFCSTCLVDGRELAPGAYDGSLSGCDWLVGDGALYVFGESARFDPDGEDGATLVVAQASDTNGVDLASVTVVRFKASMKTVPQHFCEGWANLRCAVLEEGVTRISGNAFYNCSSLKTVLLPDSLERIDSSAFSRSGLESVRLPPNLKILDGDSTFVLTKLRDVRIPGSVGKIGSRTFQACQQLTNVVIEAGVTNIDRQAFSRCSALKSVRFLGDAPVASGTGGVYTDSPLVVNYASNASIGWGSVWPEGDADARPVSIDYPIKDGVLTVSVAGSTNGIDLAVVTAAVVKASFERIPNGYFRGWPNLCRIELEEGVQRLGSSSFQDCPQLRDVILPDSLVTLGTWSFAGCSSLTELEIPDNVTTVPTHFCDGATALRHVTMPTALKSVGEAAFKDCRSLLRVSFPCDAPKGGASVYEGTPPELVNAVTKRFVEGWGETWPAGDNFSRAVEQVAPVFVDGVLTLADVADTNGIDCASVTSIVIMATVRTVPARLCEGWPNLLSASLQEGVQSVGTHAFCNCSNLVSVSLPSTLTTLGAWAFRYCSLEAVELPRSLTSLGSYMFEGAKMTSVRIPSQITTLEQGVFYNCRSLETVYVEKGVSTVKDHAFSSCRSLQMVSFEGDAPAGAATVYSGTPLTLVNVVRTGRQGWGDVWPAEGAHTRAVQVVDVFSEGVLTMVDASDTNGVDLASVTSAVFLASMKTVPENFCKGWANLRCAVLEEGITKIDYMAFASCSNLTTVLLPDSLEFIASSAFNRSGLESVRLPPNLRNLDGDSMFVGTKLRDVRIPGSVGKIGSRAFQACKQLTNVVIEAGVTNISRQAFSGCSALKNVHFLGDAPVVSGENIYEGATIVFNRVGRSARGWGDVWPPDDPSARPVAWENPFFDGELTVWREDDTNGVNLAAVTKIVFKRTFNNGFVPNQFCYNYGASAGVWESLQSAVLEEGITGMGQCVFYGCRNFRSVSLPSTLTKIGWGSFIYSAIETLTLPEGLEEIPTMLFTGSSNLRAVGIPDSVRKIGDRAFSGCTSLAKCQVGSGVTNIDYSAFLNCKVLTDVFFAGDAPSSGEKVFENTPEKMVCWIGSDAKGWGSTWPVGDPYARTVSTWYEEKVEIQDAEHGTFTVRVPHVWLDRYPALLASVGGDYARAAVLPSPGTDGTGKIHPDGHEVCLWEDCLVGTNPEESSDLFVAVIDVIDGSPCISWYPDLNADGIRRRRYTLWGKETLDETWREADDSCRFFKVSVEDN